MSVPRNLLILTLLLILCQNSGGWARSLKQAKKTFYEKGLEYKDEGNWVKALGTWFAGRKLLEAHGKSDPRIAIAFIETATEKEATEYYELACSMYYWGMAPNHLPQHKKAVQNEIERIAPILDKKRSQKWHKLLRQNEAFLYDNIKSFWLEKDPTPSTIRNERLLEHWERIAHARSHFQKEKNTIYGSDDRGLIYVKYGKPERIITGTLGANRASLKSWTDIILESGDDGRGAIGEGSFTSDAVEQTFLLQEIDRFNHFPQYEIWFYHSFNTNEPVFYLFGNDEGIGRFGLRNGVEDFIPSRAFLVSSARNTKGISPGVVLQSVYYSELMHLAPFFEDRYNELEVVWGALNSQQRAPIAQLNTTFRLMRQHFETSDRFDPLYVDAPIEQSNFYDTVSTIELMCYPFRFLDDNRNDPKLALVTISYPRFQYELADLTKTSLVPKHSMTHTLVIQDHLGRGVDRVIDALAPGTESISTFVLAHNQSQYGYELIAEAFNLESSQIKFAQPGKVQRVREVIGVGKTEIAGRPPLHRSTDMLELSDLVVGVKKPAGTNASLLPFPLVPSKRISSNDMLKTYFEVYHLALDEEGQAHFAADFEVVRFEGKKKTKEESLSLSFNLVSHQITSKESFDIDISKLAVGHYELSVTVTDTETGQRKQRTAQFEIRSDVGES